MRTKDIRKYKKNKVIKNFDNIKTDNNNFIFHAGTKFKKNKLLSNGGRVLNFSSTGKNFFNIKKNILKLLKKFNWKDGFYRKDIGWRVIK